MSLIFLFNLKHLSKKNLIEKSSYSTLTMAGNIKPYPHFLQLMVFLILPLFYIHYNIIGILNIVIIIILERVFLFSHASMPLSYQSYAFVTIVYFVNCMPTPTLHLSSSYAKFFGSQPNYPKLHFFGCLCYPWPL